MKDAMWGCQSQKVYKVARHGTFAASVVDGSLKIRPIAKEGGNLCLERSMVLVSTKQKYPVYQIHPLFDVDFRRIYSLSATAEAFKQNYNVD